MKIINLSNRKYLLLLLIVLIFILGLRILSIRYVQSVAPSRILTPDSFSYDNSAKALLRIGRFAISSDQPHTPQTVRTPGYSIFIAAIYSVFGEEHLPVIVIQILISIGTILITFLVARTLWNPRVALLSALLLSLDLGSFTSSQMLLTETLFSFMLIAAVAFGIGLILERRYLIRYALLLGVCLSLATLVRPVSYYLIFPVLIGSFGFGRIARWKWKEIMTVLLLIVLPWVILVGGWQLRNFLVSGNAEFSHIRGRSLLHYRGAAVIAQRDRISLAEARQKIYTSLPDTEGWSKERLYQFYAQEGLSLIRRYPLLYIKVMMQGIVYIMIGPGDTDLTRHLGIKDPDEKTGPLGDLFRLSFSRYLRKYLLDRPLEFITFIFAMAYLLILYTGIIYSLLRIASVEKNRLFAHIFILGIVTYILIMSAGPEAYVRFRVPIIPVLVIYAAEGINHFINKLRISA